MSQDNLTANDYKNELAILCARIKTYLNSRNQSEKVLNLSSLIEQYEESRRLLYERDGVMPWKAEFTTFIEMFE